MRNSSNRLQNAPSAARGHRGDRIRVALADDHPIVRYALRELLRLEPDMEVVGESAGGAEKLQAGVHDNADVLIADFRISDPAVSAALEARRLSGRKPKLVLLSGAEDRKEFVQALQLGCSGVVLKTSTKEDIVACIRTVHGGGMWVDCQAKTFVLQQTSDLNDETRDLFEDPFFSRREHEVLAMVLQGFTNSEIAERLRMSPNTVRIHLHHMYSKIGVQDRLELVLYSIRAGRMPYLGGVSTSAFAGESSRCLAMGSVAGV